MSKFAQARVTPRAPIVTTTDRRLTHEGGLGWSRDPKSDLFLLAVTNMVGEDTFYESATVRDGRFRDLVRKVIAEDPEWVAGFVPYLRDVMQMRTASVVLAAEYVAAGGGDRDVVASALRRADEPAELLAYWHQTYGRSVPKPIKRGVALAVERLYDERAVLRYDGKGNRWRFANVIELVHPHYREPWQRALYKYLRDDAYGRESPRGIESLPKIDADRFLQSIPEDLRRETLRGSGGSALRVAEWSWERLSGWLPGGMDAEAWEAVIPNMGYMALLRNLRNFDEAGVSDEVALIVSNKLMAQDEVARSRQFPIRFLSAWREIPSLRWAFALERALDHSLANVPSLPGRTLVLLDWSGSMWGVPISARSKRQRWEVATIFGAALAKRAEHASVVAYGTSHVSLDVSPPLLKVLDHATDMGGTNTMQTLADTYRGEDRVVILTDEQARDAGHDPVPAGVPVYTFNVAGYAPAHLPSGEKARYTFGGLTDACFRMISLLEQHRSARWPWEEGTP